MTLDIKSALAEILEKTDEEIERETADKWAARTIACVLAYLKSKDKRYLTRATGYKQEAIEHAALVMDQGATVKEIQNAIEQKIGDILKDSK